MPLTPLQPFVGYEPNPQGPGYMFQHNNGNKYLSYGPAAEQLRAQIDASKPKAPQPLAMNGMNAADANASFDAGAPNVAVPDTGPAPIMAPPPQAAPMPQPPEPQRTGTTTVEHPEPPPPEHVNEPPGRVVPPTGQLPVMRGASSPAEAAGQPAAPPIPQRGFVYTPGRNPAAEAKNAVAVPTAQSVVTEGGIQDPAARQEAIDLFHKQAEAQKNLAQVQENAATTQLEMERANLLEAQKRQQDAEAEIANQQARQVTIRKEFDNRMAIAQQDYDTSSKKEIDQYRMFKGSTGGTVAGILATIGASMGAAGAAYGHGTPNYALNILQRTIDNDVDAQRDEIHRGVAKSSNDLKRISDQYNLDYDDAASVLKMNYARRAEAELAKKAAMNGTQQAQLAFAQVQPTFQKWQADAAAEMNASLNGKVRIAQESKMVTPTRGGVSLESDAAYSKRLEQAAKDEKNKNAIAHGGIAQKPGAEKTPGEIVPNLARAAVATDEGLAGVDHLIAMNEERGALGTAWDKVQQKAYDTKWKAAVNHSSQSIASAEAKGLAPDKARTAELESDDMLNSGNYYTVRNHLQSLRDTLKRQHDAIKDISSKTARVGSVGPVAEGGSEE